MLLESLTALVGLTVMEIVLGIDNVVFLAIVVTRLPAPQQPRARTLGLMLALLTRIGLLFTLSWMMRLTQPFLSVAGIEVTGRGLILVLGGLFLIGKGTQEIHAKIEGVEERHAPRGRALFGLVLIQIAVLDIVFSLDSVITAIGMARDLWVMVAAMVAAMFVMLAAACPISSFIDRRPTMKILALSVLILIGVMLVAEGLGKHIEKGYIYFAMAFSVLVELLNTRMRAKRARAARPGGATTAEACDETGRAQGECNMAMTHEAGGLPAAKAVELHNLVAYQNGAIVSRTLAKKNGGTVTLFAFDAGQALSEHTAPFDAIVQILEGEAELTIGGAKVPARAGQTVCMPAGVPHSVHAAARFKMLLVMVREVAAGK